MKKIDLKNFDGDRYFREYMYLFLKLNDENNFPIDFLKPCISKFYEEYKKVLKENGYNFEKYPLSYNI